MSVVSAIDKHTQHQQFGEKGHVEYSWKERSGGYEGDICKIFFQMVRSSGTKKATHAVEKQVITLLASLREQWHKIGSYIITSLGDAGDQFRESCKRSRERSERSDVAATGAGEEEESNPFLKLEEERNRILNSRREEQQELVRLLTLLYRLSAHTRDIVAGKGERDLAYAMVLIWYNFVPSLGFQLASRFWSEHGERSHPYGSWKDVKYLCDFLVLRGESRDHPLIKFAIEELVAQLKQDYAAITESAVEDAGEGTGEDESAAPVVRPRAVSSVSLAARWVPREKSHFSWLYGMVAKQMYPHIYETARSVTRAAATERADRLARMQLRRMLSALNKHIDTTQIKMCGRVWRDIEFNRVTSSTMGKNRIAFTNKKKDGARRSNDIDRIACAEHLSAHVEAVKSGDKKAKIHGKRLNVYEMVRDAHNLFTMPEGDAHAILNLQWADSAKTTGALGAIIPMADTSGSMTQDNSVPLYSALGLSLRVSECAHPAFRNRVLTFSEAPSWVNLESCATFIDKVKTLARAPWGMNTNFYAAARLILDSLVENDVSPDDVRGLTLAVFSDMQIDTATGSSSSSFMKIDEAYKAENERNVMYDNIREMFAEAGLRTKHKVPYDPPHILFWNLRSTSGFPVMTTTENVTMLSGYSSALLNAFCDKGVDALREFTPIKMLTDILSHERYSALDDILSSHSVFYV